ncbi:MAG TPA: methyltransferase domain-containing protein, partial [Gaiellaceae bacterium]
MEHDPIVDEFTHQSEAFNRSPVMRSADTLGRLIEALPCSPGERWLEAACGPGLVARALAPRVAAVHGVDLTPAMIELAQRESAREGIGNVTYSVGDVTRLEFDDASFDGAVTRFSLHHIPRPVRVLRELARVVRPGGPVVVADHLTSADSGVAAWHQELERLRDPSHWACLSSDRLAELGAQAGLELKRFDEYPFSLDYDEWLERGSGGQSAREL